MTQVPPERSVIRFEDLGEPMQQLLCQLKGDVDMSLLNYISVKDMATVIDGRARNLQVSLAFQLM